MDDPACDSGNQSLNSQKTTGNALNQCSCGISENFRLLCSTVNKFINFVNVVVDFVLQTKAPEQMFSFHAGAITGVSVSPVTDLMCTVGRDRSMRVYDYVTKHQLTVRKFHAAVTCIKWLPISVSKQLLIYGF